MLIDVMAWMEKNGGADGSLDANSDSASALESSRYLSKQGVQDERTALENDITFKLIRLDPEFKNLTIRVDRKRCGCITCTDTGASSLIVNFNVHTARVLSTILEDSDYASLLPGIKNMLHHEIGHIITKKVKGMVELKKESKFFGPKFGKYEKLLRDEFGASETKDARFFAVYGGSETAAEMYALNKAEDPVDSLASLAAFWVLVSIKTKDELVKSISRIEAGSDDLREGLREAFRKWFPNTHLYHWMDANVYALLRNGDLIEMDDMPTNYRFPISEAAFDKVIGGAANKLADIWIKDAINKLPSNQAWYFGVKRYLSILSRGIRSNLDFLQH